MIARRLQLPALVLACLAIAPPGARVRNTRCLLDGNRPTYWCPRCQS